MTTIETGPLGFGGYDALILCDLINKDEYMNALVNYRAGDEELDFDPKEPGNQLAFPLEDVEAADGTFRAGYPRNAGPSFADVVEFHASGRAVEAATALFDGGGSHAAPETGTGEAGMNTELVTTDAIIAFLERVQGNPKQREALAYLVERFSGTIRNGTSRRILQSLGMFIEYTVKAENAEVINTDPVDTDAIRPNRLMW